MITASVGLSVCRPRATIREGASASVGEASLRRIPSLPGPTAPLQVGRDRLASARSPGRELRESALRGNW